MILNRLLSKKAGISYLEIWILIVAIFSFSYLLCSATGVSAEEISWNTCLKDKEGHICQEYLSTECNEKCETNCIPTAREFYSECKLGCCYNADEGICTIKATKAQCEDGGGIWKDNELCDFPQCEKGCCILGNQAEFLTSRRCEKRADGLGLEAEFKSEIKSESECILLTKTEDKGACVYEVDFEKTCKFTTRGDCVSKTGTGDNFYEDYLCSNLELETNCEKQHHTGCVEGRDEVYWIDSCGNRENIYSSDKLKSWNKGVVLEKNESCDYGSSNIDNSNCGNCDHFLGSICREYSSSKDTKKNDGEFVCRDLRCKDSSGKIRQNGESWCEYESYIGEGKDVVGSRHVRHTCYMGEERIELCADYRNEICVQENTKINGKIFSSAVCRLNRWQMCFDANNREGSERTAECEANSDCFVNSVIFGDSQFNFCSPRYPPGFDLKDEGSGQTAEEICGMASQKCTVVYVKKVSGWDCVANCGCEELLHTKQMNELCTSLGDCGGYVNVVGEATDYGYSVIGAPKIDLNQYKKYSEPVKGQKAEPGNLSEFAGYLGIPSGIGQADYDEDSALGFGKILSATVGGMGIGTIGIYITGGLTSSGISSLPIQFGYLGGTQHLTTGAGAFGTLALGATIGAVVGGIISKIAGLEGDAAFLTAVGGATGGTIGGAVAASEGAGVGGVSLAALVWAAIIAIIITIISKILGLGETKEKTIIFTCKPWQAPIGGKDCGKCNGGDVACSKYKCQSLGQACEFVNQGTGQEKCIWNNPNDASAPRINPLIGTITEGYAYENINDRGFQIKNKEDEYGCVPAFTPLLFGIETDELASCKFDSVHTDKFESMAESFGSSLLLKEHVMRFSLPSVESLANQYNVTSEFILEKYGDLNFYIRCRDANGNENINEYVIKMCVKPQPDTTAPYITKTEPGIGYIAYGENEKKVAVYVNEPAECRWDKEDVEYSLMKNEMGCLNDVNDAGLYGWQCNATLTNIKNNSAVYIRCKDKPWESDDTKRNVMIESYEYVLRSSASELRIDDISPFGEFYSGTELTTVQVEARTSGGAEDGLARCEWGVEKGKYISAFQETYSRVSRQTLTNRAEREYNIYVKCEDVAGNSAENSTSFEIKVDSQEPKVVRVFYDGSLKIITNEDAECGYSFDDCGFDVGGENITSMGGFGRTHTADWNEGKTYFIRCRDEFGREACVIKIRSYNLN